MFKHIGLCVFFWFILDNGLDMIVYVKIDELNST